MPDPMSIMVMPASNITYLETEIPDDACSIPDCSNPIFWAVGIWSAPHIYEVEPAAKYICCAAHLEHVLNLCSALIIMVLTENPNNLPLTDFLDFMDH